MTLRTVVPRLVPGLVIAGAAVWLALNRDRVDPGLIETSIRDLGLWAPLGHVILFAIATVLFVPGVIFSLAGGVLFGPVLGTVLNLIGATLGATLAFLASRYLAAEWIRRKAGGKLVRLTEGVEAEGWRFVAFVRLVPLFPFNLLNYALGLTRIPLAQYVVASLICMVPGSIAYTYLGYAGREVFTGSEALVRTGLIALGLVAFAVFVPRIIRRMRATAPDWRVGGRPGATVDRVSWIEADTLTERLGRDPKPTIVDVRGADEFIGSLGHIANALNLPVGELPNRMTEIDGLKEKPIILVCRTQMRSANAAKLLSDAGFQDLRVLHGGMERWNHDGLPVEGRTAQHTI